MSQGGGQSSAVHSQVAIWGDALRATLPALLVGGACLLGLLVNYLVFHVLAEGFSIVIALSALMVASTSWRFTKNHFLIYIAIGIGWCAVLDVVHTLAFKGMGLLPVDGANPATQLWIAARYLQAAVMISAPLFLRRAVRMSYLHAGYGLAVAAILVLIGSGAFPDAYIEGQGLTPFKIYSEYLIIVLLAATLILLWRMRDLMTRQLFITTSVSIVAMMLAEFAFTRYVSVYAGANLVGHLLKIVAYWFIYVALVERTLQEPFHLLDSAQQSLRESEFRWRFAIEGAGDGLWDWDVPSGRIFFSKRWKEMLGHTQGEIGDGLDEWEKRVHPDDHDRAMAEVTAHLQGRTAQYVNEHRVRCKDGSWKWILDRGLVVERDARGQPLRVIGTHTDITGYRAAEAKFRGLVEQTLVGVYMLDGVDVLYVNPRAAEILGYVAAELVGKPLLPLIADEDRDKVLQFIERINRRESRIERVEYRARHRDGKTVIVGSEARLADVAGSPVVIGVLQDITSRVRSEEQVRDYVARLEHSVLGTVDAVSQMMDVRDPYTSGHMRRVGEVAAAIAAEMGLHEHVQRGLRVAGAVHDVGKIAVPAEILGKPGRISDIELEMVRTHAQEGYEVLKGIDFPWPVAEVARQHHERIDGSGYPRALKGDQILLEARVLAVADVIEAMASHRPYRAGIGLEKALAEVERGRGTIYDASAADACLRLFRDKGYALPG